VSYSELLKGDELAFLHAVSQILVSPRPYRSRYM